MTINRESRSDFGLASFCRRNVIRIKRKILKTVLTPKFKLGASNLEIIRLGSQYGGWSLVPRPNLFGGVILSAGLGEDASFDIETAQFFNCSIFIIDPTPRALVHFSEIKSQIGSAKTNSFNSTGKQEVSSYDLTDIKPSQLNLIDSALWITNNRIKFFEPANKSHVSFSIGDIQNESSVPSSYIEVDSITVSKILDLFEIKRIDLLKLDIEGAETEVIIDLMKGKIFPEQILVEYDEINFPSLSTKRKIEKCHEVLLLNGYALLHVEKPSNFTYVRTTL